MNRLLHWLRHRKDNDKATLEQILREAKHIHSGESYLLFVKKGSISHQVLNRANFSEFGIKVMILQTWIDPKDCVQLFRINPEKPL